MKLKHTAVSALSLLVTLFASCISNDPYPVMYQTMGTVTDITSYTIDSDSYGMLVPNNPKLISMNNADSVGQRVFVNITFQKENEKKRTAAKEVDIFELVKVLTKDADDLRTSTSESIDDFGDAPIQIMPTQTGAYISKDHLNLEFYIDGENTEIPHRISLLLTEETTIDDEGLLRVELKHNNFSDGIRDKFWGIVSFTLSSIPEYADPKFRGFRIAYKSMGNINTEIKVFKPSDKSGIGSDMKSAKEVAHGHTLLAGKLQ